MRKSSASSSAIVTPRIAATAPQTRPCGAMTRTSANPKTTLPTTSIIWEMAVGFMFCEPWK